MIRRYKPLKSLVSRGLRSSSSHARPLPSAIRLDSSNPPTEDASIIQWLTSPSPESPPPPVSYRVHLSYKNATMSLTTSSQTAHTLTHAQSLQASINLLSSSTPLLRSPPSLPHLTIEYSSPNIAKPLHMGHLRSTLTGSYVRNVAEFAGHSCRSISFLGDWGRQFGVLHAGVLQSMSAANSTDFQTYVKSLTLQKLLQIYVTATSTCDKDPDFSSQARRLSAELEQSFGSDTPGNFLWSHTRSITVDHLKSCYSDLGISFDDFEGESTYNRDSSHTTKALEILETSGLSRRHPDGSLRVKTGDTESILLKRDDSSVYLLRDIACALHRHSRHPHNVVYVVDQGQSSHFKNLFEILRNLGISNPSSDPHLPFTSAHTHVPFGKVAGMSTRSGNFVLLSEVIEQGTQLMHESRRKSKNARNLEDLTVSQRLAVSGLIVNALKVRRTKTAAFDWNEALRSNGNSGVALQYTIARLGSLERRVAGGDGGDVTEGIDGKLRTLFGSGRGEIVELIVCLMNFEDMFWKSYTSLEPCVLVSYAFNLSDKVSKALSTLNVLNEKDRNLADAALWLFHASRLKLEKCTIILGIQPVGEF